MLRSLLAALAAALTFAAPASAAGDAEYWSFADRLQQRFDPLWDEQAGYYRLGPGGVETMGNAMLLLTHAVAAQHGHVGPARNDQRARILAETLIGAPFAKRPGAGQPHVPGWTNGMTGGGQHVVVDAEVADGLVHAYRARAALKLPASTVRAIRDAIHRTARGEFWRYPAIRLNQVNWYAQLYAADATVTGDPTLLRRDLRLQLERFFARARENFGRGMRFHYLPHRPAARRMNVDSAEYANIVLSFTRVYAQARRAGMAPLSSRAQALLREWVARAVAGYWTHAGYLNWDTGFGFGRWHQAKKLGLTQEALLGLAATDGLADPRWSRWAKTLFDRGLAFYARQSPRAAVLFDLDVVPQGEGSARLAATRMLANAARAVAAGLGRRQGEEPPALYAFDPDIGRLAVTTPAYNTAIVPISQGAFPYGGLDLARLFDGRQEVAANIGGRPPAAFGLLLRDGAGRRAGVTQIPRRELGGRPLRVLGVSASARGRAYAGPFTDLRATGTTTTPAFKLRVSHRFTPDWIQTSWAAERREPGAYQADVLFPSWGGRAASVVAVLRDGSRPVLGRRSLDLSRVLYLWVRSDRSGYVVVPSGRPSGARVRILPTEPQSSAPRPGPTLAIRIASGSRFSRADLTVRLTPVHDRREAAAAAERIS